MICACHAAAPTQFPDAMVSSGGQTEAAFFAAVQCGCGSTAWQVSANWACGPGGRVLHCRRCGREEWVTAPGVLVPAEVMKGSQEGRGDG